VVFLDELTTGLDPQARRAFWELIRGIRARGKTVFLTTHLMEEAERLCDRVAIIDRGRLIDVGTPAALIQRHCPATTVVVTTADVSAEAVFRELAEVEALTRTGDEFAIRGRSDDVVTATIRAIAAHGLHVTGFRTERPTLEDVFLQVTGHAIRD
jgi:ABC-2 type transport system ATP-binding protein